MASSLPGRGLLGWLGRQVGYVRGAIRSDPGAKKIYRTESVDEQPHPADPNVVLRRTTIDEAIVQRATPATPPRPREE